ncbi:uncharacterized protein PV06_05167 [Exophiala oligosperma]|uniref:O-methyltransferase n=1 Tax=Exophiala oligosperma TaxID=215243 RepID=A0A0D2DMF0_9EURO|nr:uncharacterized protein PV06_05167 [Exophiala oligosperma]KIW44133.1 hypothetical protein PV06_05167 [Exophiala oligosperma]
MASSQSPVHAPPHVLELLSELHQRSIDQEAAIAGDRKNITSETEDQYEARGTTTGGGGDESRTKFDQLMLDKFIALDQDKCEFMYQLINAMGATNVVEAGTSFGVSTIYLALAVAQTKAATGKPGTVIATEKETSKAEVARRYWARCGAQVEEQIDLRVGDLRETLKVDLPVIDLLLLDSKYPYLVYLLLPFSTCLVLSSLVYTEIPPFNDGRLTPLKLPVWTPMVLPTLKTVLPRLRHGAVVLADNTISSAKGYEEFLTFVRNPENGFRNMTLPFNNGFEMSVYLPKSG